MGNECRSEVRGTVVRSLWEGETDPSRRDGASRSECLLRPQRWGDLLASEASGRFWLAFTGGAHEHELWTQVRCRHESGRLCAGEHTGSGAGEPLRELRGYVVARDWQIAEFIDKGVSGRGSRALLSINL